MTEYGWTLEHLDRLANQREAENILAHDGTLAVAPVPTDFAHSCADYIDAQAGTSRSWIEARGSRASATVRARAATRTPAAIAHRAKWGKFPSCARKRSA